MWIDSKQTFAVHIKKTIQKRALTVRALYTSVPNIGGPKASTRKLYSSVVNSQMLYGALEWHEATKLNSLQSVKFPKAVVVGLSPIELRFIERRKPYTGTSTYSTNDKMLKNWQVKRGRSVNERWTLDLIPVIERWTNRQNEEVDYCSRKRYPVTHFSKNTSMAVDDQSQMTGNIAWK